MLRQQSIVSELNARNRQSLDTPRFNIHEKQRSTRPRYELLIVPFCRKSAMNVIFVSNYLNRRFTFDSAIVLCKIELRTRFIPQETTIFELSSTLIGGTPEQQKIGMLGERLLYESMRYVGLRIVVPTSKEIKSCQSKHSLIAGGAYFCSAKDTDADYHVTQIEWCCITAKTRIPTSFRIPTITAFRLLLPQCA